MSTRRQQAEPSESDSTQETLSRETQAFEAQRESNMAKIAQQLRDLGIPEAAALLAQRPNKNKVSIWGNFKNIRFRCLDCEYVFLTCLDCEYVFLLVYFLLLQFT